MRNPLGKDSDRIEAQLPFSTGNSQSGSEPKEGIPCGHSANPEKRESRPPRIDRAETGLLAFLGALIAIGSWWPQMIQEGPPEGIVVKRSGEESLPVSGRAWLELPEESPLGAFDLNTAGRGDLMTLRGIGPSLSGAILEYRERNGPFASVEELKEVPGIGDAKLEAIRSRVYVESSTGSPNLNRPAQARPIDVPIRAGDSPVADSAGPPSRPGDEEIQSLNRARREDLLSIPGVGPALADRILEERERTGEFSTWDQVEKVPGIGPKRLENIRQKVRIR